MLGGEESCVYLLESGKETMIVSGGMSYLVPEILHQIDAFGLDVNRISKILIVHAHFDHLGIIPFLKRQHPDVEIYGSERAWEILSMPKAISTINKFSLGITRRMGRNKLSAEYDLEWTLDITGKTVREGDEINLGELGIRIYETPGHSSCSISVYVPQLKALFASDGGGIPYEDTIIISGNSNFTRYQESLEKLKVLDVAYVCADHYGYIVGEEAKGFIKRAIDLAEQQRSAMEAMYRRTRDIDASTKEMTDLFFKKYPDYIISPEIYLGIYRQMFRHIAEALDEIPS
jgi:glyoxylase-like metal-dependent hydrolase (beta-lactamase superfamily II)